MKPKIRWLGHSTVFIESTFDILIDPWKLEKNVKADVILITHSHFDHLSPDDIRKALKPGGKIFATGDCKENLGSIDFTPVKPNQIFFHEQLKLETVHAYNPEKEFHPKSNDWVGYIIEIDGSRIYVAGDTDLIPEMANVKTDIAILPVGGTYTMDIDSAVKATLIINPNTVIPIHYGDIVGSADEGNKFAKELEGKVDVLILNPEKLKPQENE